ncbi:MAG TPA: hypothetical protein PL033_15825 [Candidatus Brocadiia bacterium]|nr:hypothetical protein [Candidatus Brocadiia bacterium]
MSDGNRHMPSDAFRVSFSQPEGRLKVASARKPVDNVKHISKAPDGAIDGMHAFKRPFHGLVGHKRLNPRVAPEATARRRKRLRLRIQKENR